MNLNSIVTSDLLDEKFDKELSLILTGLIAEVDSYSKTKRTAKVIPLIKIESKNGYKRLPAIVLPVMTYVGNGLEIIPDFKKGDLVQLAGNILPIENQMKGQSELDFSQKHKLENMIIIGGITKQPSVLSPTVQKDGLVITDNQSMYAQFSSNKIELKSGSDTPQKSLLGEDTIDLISDLIDAILESTVMTPVGPSSPISAIPTNLTKLNLLKTKLNTLLSNGVKHN